MDNKLKKIINFAKKTGDRVIVFDPSESGGAFVVMSTEEYEKIIFSKKDIGSLTENELIDKINRDIAIWKNSQELGSQDGDFGHNIGYNKRGHKEQPDDFFFNEAVCGRLDYPEKAGFYKDDYEADYEDYSEENDYTLSRNEKPERKKEDYPVNQDYPSNQENKEQNKEQIDEYFTKIGSIIDAPNYGRPNREKVVKKSKDYWKIPLARKKKAEEIIEEDRHYLESVDY